MMHREIRFKTVKANPAVWTLELYAVGFETSTEMLYGK
jgi:hypothetical protein